MRQRHLWFESVLIGITIFLGTGVLATRYIHSLDFGFLAAMWFVVLGILQVFHSFFIGFNHWENKQIRKSISVYWIAVALDFLSMFVNSISYGRDVVAITTILIIPCCLAIYLWFITFKFRMKITG